MVQRGDRNHQGDPATPAATVIGGGGGGGPVNRAPVFLDAEGNAISEARREIASGAVLGASVGEPVVAMDPDEDMLTYTVSGDDAASFAIDASTGQLTTGTVLDHEIQASYAVTVIATDPSGADAEVRVTITVTEVVFDCSTGNAVADAADHPGSGGRLRGAAGGPQPAGGYRHAELVGRYSHHRVGWCDPWRNTRGALPSCTWCNRAWAGRSRLTWAV